jgi:hypothetical protein
MVNTPIERNGSTSRIPLTAASAVIPPPTIKYAKCDTRAALISAASSFNELPSRFTADSSRRHEIRAVPVWPIPLLTYRVNSLLIIAKKRGPDCRLAMFLLENRKCGHLEVKLRQHCMDVVAFLRLRPPTHEAPTFHVDVLTNVSQHGTYKLLCRSAQQLRSRAKLRDKFLIIRSVGSRTLQRSHVYV